MYVKASMWFWLSLVLIVVISPFGIAAEKEPQYGGELRICIETDPYCLNPMITFDCASISVLNQITESLFEIDPDTGEAEPLLAKGYDVSEDGKEYTFYLHKSIQFHDGTPFNASAVKFNLDKIMDPEEGAFGAGYLGPLERVEEVDDYTVKLILSNPYAPLLNVLGIWLTSVNSPTQMQKLGDQYGEHPIGTGPFKFAEYKRDEYVLLERNNNYWQEGLPYLDKVKFIIIPEALVRKSATFIGEVDIARRIPALFVEEVEAHSEVDALIRPGLRSHYLQLNMNIAPLGDRRVRQALNYAVNKQAIVDAIYLGYASVSDCPVAVGTFGYSPVMTYEYNVEKAKELLADAGYPDGFTLEVPFLYNPGRYMGSTEAIEVILSYWKQNLNVEVKLQGMEAAAWMAETQDVKKRMEWAVNYDGWSPAPVDPICPVTGLMLASAVPPHGYNNPYYQSAGFDLLYKKSEQIIGNPERRKEALKQAWAVYMQDAPIVFLWSESLIVSIRKNVHGYIKPCYEYPILRYTWKE